MVRRTKLKPKHVLLPNMSTWTIHRLWQIPMLEVGSLFRIIHMVVEVFRGRPAERVFIGQCVTVV